VENGGVPMFLVRVRESCPEFVEPWTIRLDGREAR
jgi:hypothetical protein